MSWSVLTIDHFKKWAAVIFNEKKNNSQKVKKEIQTI